MKKTAIALFLIAFGYFGLLSAKSYTWLFTSVDSSNWLTTSTIWVVPQPMGSPLYILLGHFLNLFGGSLAIKMTILLSCLPSAITVAVVYCIASKLMPDASRVVKLIPPVVLMGAAAFLSQSTILEEYALATMFVALGYWFYLNDRRKLTSLSLGLGTAVHIMVLPIALIWLVIERQNWRVWLKQSWVFILTGILPYSMVPILMAIGTPPYMGGYFSWSALYEYVFRTAGSVAFQISVYDFPLRLGHLLAFLVVSLGLAAIPAMLGLSKPYDRAKWIIIATAAFSIGYYLLCLDYSTWTFLTFGMPFLAVLAGLGLSKLSRLQVAAVFQVALVLIIINGVFLNADTLAKADPTAPLVQEQLMALPDGSAVITLQGIYSMSAFYCISQGKDLVPTIWLDRENKWPALDDLPQQHIDYCEYMYKPRGIESAIPWDVVREMVDEFDNVYIAGAEWMLDEGNGATPWTALINLLETEGDGRIRQVIGVKELW